MRLTARRGVLLEALSRARSVVKSRHTLAILESVLLVARDGILTISGTDLETAVMAECKVQITKTGGVAVSPVTLEKLLKSVSDDRVTLNAKTSVKRWTEKISRWNSETEKLDEEEVKKSSKTVTLSIEAGNVSTTMKASPAEDFPKLPKVKGKAVTLSNLDTAIGEVIYAVAKDESRPILNGICLVQNGKKVDAAAADGWRLAISKISINGKLSGEAVVPATAMNLVKSLMPGRVNVTLMGKDGDRAIAFGRGNGLTIVSQLVSGTYPKYEQLIPKTGGKLLKVGSKALKQAIDTVMVIKPTADKVCLKTKGKSLIVSGSDLEGTETEVKIPVAGKANAAFNGKFLLDLLRRAGEEFTIKLFPAHQPGVVRNNGTTHVLMPMVENGK